MSQSESHIIAKLPLAGPAPGDPEQRFRAELVFAFGVFEIVILALFGISELFVGTAVLGALYLATTVPLLAILTLLRRGADARRAGTALIALLFALVTFTSFATGGRSIGANLALPTILLFAVLISTRRAAFAWIAFALLEITATAWLRDRGLAFPIEPNPGWVRSAVDRIPLVFCIGAAIIGFVTQRALSRFRRELDQAREAERRLHADAAFRAGRFADFAAIAADGFWETDAQLRLTYVSPSFADAMGLAAAEMIGRTPEEAYRLRFPAADGLAQYMAPLQARTAFDGQMLRTIDRAGQPRILLNQGRPYHDEAGAFLGYRGTVRDVTEQRAAERAVAASEKRLRLVADNLPALVAYVDSEQRYRFANAMNARLFGVAPESLYGRSLREERGEELYAKLRPHVEAAFRGETVTFEGRGTARGAEFDFRTTFVPDISADGRVVGFYAMTFDITDIRRGQEQLAASEARLRLITDNMPALISYIDRERRFRFNNATYSAWLGKPLEEITGRRVDEVYEAETYALIQPHLDRAFLTACSETFELVSPRSGRTFNVTYLPETAAGGEVSGVYALVHDITAQKETEANLRQLAQFDHLTGLPNRSRFHDALAEAIARSERSGELMAVVYLDIDRFKAINDRFGHQQGDAVLREFGARLLRSVRRTDTVARLAGDEFVVILESLHSGDEACDVARKILLAIGVPFAFDGTTQSVGTSIGIALRHAGETDPEALLHRADEALYAAKAAGRGRFSLAAATPIST